MRIPIFTLSLLLTTTVYAQTEDPAFVPTAEEAAQADVFAEQFAGCSALLITWAGVKTTTPEDKTQMNMKATDMSKLAANLLLTSQNITWEHAVDKTALIVAQKIALYHEVYPEHELWAKATFDCGVRWSWAQRMMDAGGVAPTTAEQVSSLSN